eukprot:Trichotokara_eunicae@DN2947_c0_g1_i2.p1
MSFELEALPPVNGSAGGGGAPRGQAIRAEPEVLVAAALCQHITVTYAQVNRFTLWDWPSTGCRGNYNRRSRIMGTKSGRILWTSLHFGGMSRASPTGSAII